MQQGLSKVTCDGRGCEATETFPRPNLAQDPDTAAAGWGDASVLTDWGGTVALDLCPRCKGKLLALFKPLVKPAKEKL